MYTGPFSFNLIKVLTMALVLAFIVFAAFADESAGDFNPGIADLNYIINESNGHISFNNNKWYTQQLLNDASPAIRTIKNSRNWLPTPPPG
jgi:hypothetical protein